MFFLVLLHTLIVANASYLLLQMFTAQLNANQETKVSKNASKGGTREPVAQQADISRVQGANANRNTSRPAKDEANELSNQAAITLASGLAASNKKPVRYCWLPTTDRVRTCGLPP